MEDQRLPSGNFNKAQAVLVLTVVLTGAGFLGYALLLGGKGDEGSDWKAYQNEEYKFSVSYPATGEIYKYKKCGLINAPYYKTT